MFYSTPIASEASQGLYDSSYDGKNFNGILSHGLGRLVDGEVGLDNFRLDIGYGKGIHIPFHVKNRNSAENNFRENYVFLCRKWLGILEKRQSFN